MERNDEYFRTLAKEAKDNKKAMVQLIEEMEPRIEKVVSYYVRNVKSAECYVEDLRSYAMEGIFKAVQRFDFSRNGFLAYAERSMEMEVRAFLTESIRTIRFPKYIVGAIKKLTNAQEYFASIRVVPDEKDLMERTGISSKKTYQAVKEAYMLQETYSLDYDYSKDEEGDCLLEALCPSSEDVADDVEERSLDNDLYGEVMALNETDRYVILHSYGLYGKQILSNGEMADHLHLTTASVINHRNRALAVLKTNLGKWSC